MTKPVFLLINQILNLSDFNKDFFLKVILSIIGAIVGMIITYILTRRKEKMDLKEISYDLDVKDVIIKADKTIQDNISITYKGNHTKNLSFVNCNIKNTGNKVVKDEYVRFEFDKETEILETFFDPEPIPEFGVTFENTEQKQNEKRIKVKHLEKAQSININFIVNGKKSTPKLIPFNEQGDVLFNTNTLTQIKNEQDILKDFIRMNFAMIIILPLIIATNYLDTNIGFSAWIVFGLFVIIGNLFFINKIPKILIDLFFATKPKIVETINTMNFAENVKDCLGVQNFENNSLHDIFKSTNNADKANIVE